MDKTLIITRLKYFYARKKRMPTYGEMCNVLGYRSKGAVRYVVQKLIEEGVVEKAPDGKLFPKDLLTLPLLGVIKAGFPIPVEVQPDNQIHLHVLFEQAITASFALIVSGDSMIDAGIHEGDYVIVNKNLEARNGDIVAARIDNEWTVKFLQKDENGVLLIPANSNYPAMYPEQTLEIGGVVVNVIRKYH